MIFEKDKVTCLGVEYAQRRGDTCPFIESNEGNKMLYSQDTVFMHSLAKLIKLQSNAPHAHPYHYCEWLQLVFLTKSVCHCTNVNWFYRVRSCLLSLTRYSFLESLWYCARAVMIVFPAHFRCRTQSKARSIPRLCFLLSPYAFVALNEFCNMINNITAI